MVKYKLDRMSEDAAAVYARLAGDVAREILLAIARENKNRPDGFTKKDLADLIGRDKGFITKALSGARNLELRTIAAMLGAMGYAMDVKARPVRATMEQLTNHRPSPSADGTIIASAGAQAYTLNTTNSAASYRKIDDKTQLLSVAA